MGLAAAGALERAAFAGDARHGALLDSPDGRAPEVHLQSHPMRHDALVSPTLDAFRRHYPGHRQDPLWVDQAMAALMDGVLAAHTHTERPSARRLG